MQKIKTKINSMRSEDLAIVGIRVVETIEKSVAEEVKNSLLFTQLIEVTNRFRKAIGPDDKEEKAVLVLWAIIELYAKLFTWYKISCS